MSLLAALALLANPAHAKPTDPPGLRIDGVVPTAYEARLTLDPDEDRFSGTATASLTLAERQKVIWLNAIDLDITEASLNVAGEAVPVTVIEGDELGRVAVAGPLNRLLNRRDELKAQLTLAARTN